MALPIKYEGFDLEGNLLLSTELVDVTASENVNTEKAKLYFTAGLILTLAAQIKQDCENLLNSEFKQKIETAFSSQTETEFGIGEQKFNIVLTSNT